MRFFIVLIAALVFAGLVSSGRSLYEIIRLSREKASEVRDRDAALERKALLEAEAARLRSDSLYIEEIARREYGMIKPGEEAFTITLPDTLNGEGRNEAGN